MNAAEEVTYESLVNRWKKELRGTAVTRLDPTFYQSVDAHVRQLSEDYQREHALNPSSSRAMMLQDELRNVTRARDDIYDLREKKIAIAALVAARGGNPDKGSFTRGELELYEELVRVLKEGRRSMLKRGERDASAPSLAPAAGAPPAPPEPPQFTAPPAERAATATPVEPAPQPEAPLPGLPVAPAPSSAPEAAPVVVAVDTPQAAPRPRSGRVLVRVTKAVDPFTGSDLRTYRLAAEDVVALPADIAGVLVARGHAVSLTA